MGGITAMTTFERFTRLYQHKDPDTVPIIDWVWESAIWRWWKEGMPKDVVWDAYFGIDRCVQLPMDTSPRFEELVVEETDSYIINRDRWGLTQKNFKPVSSTVQHIDSIIKDPDTWKKAKERVAPSKDRIDWNYYKENYKKLRQDGAWLSASPWFGQDVVSTRMIDSETVLYAMAENPEWVKDMCDTQTDVALACCDMIWDAGYHFDEIMWYDDMSYRNGMLFSKDMWREIIRPYQKRVIDWAHSHGIKAHLHCCGNINALVPDLLELGIDCLNPLEVKAGMDLIKMKETYGDRLALRGGFDIQHWSNPEIVEADLHRMLPVAMQSGGYIFASDHSIPDSVGIEDYKRIIKLVREIGKY
jgi:uroporphyrinogen decarboxylase